MPLPPKESSSRGSSVYRNVLAVTLLVAVLCSALMSWSSSRTLSFSLGGAWKSVDEGRLIASCEGASTWSGVCTFESSHIRFSGPVQASPLSGGGWVAVVRAAPLSTSVFVHRGKVLTVATEMEDGSTRRTVYTRDQARTEDFLSAVRMKGKYIVALFVMVGAYKWVQVAVFGTSTRRLRRF